MAALAKNALTKARDAEAREIYKYARAAFAKFCEHDDFEWTLRNFRLFCERTEPPHIVSVLNDQHELSELPSKFPTKLRRHSAPLLGPSFSCLLTFAYLSWHDVDPAQGIGGLTSATLRMAVSGPLDSSALTEVGLDTVKPSVLDAAAQFWHKCWRTVTCVHLFASMYGSCPKAAK